jgi:hypothetical protein
MVPSDEGAAVSDWLESSYHQTAHSARSEWLCRGLRGPYDGKRVALRARTLGRPEFLAPCGWPALRHRNFGNFGGWQSH